MFKTRKLYLQSAKHWKVLILEEKQIGYLPVSFCPFCKDAFPGSCDTCKVDRKICYRPEKIGTTLIHKIQENRTNEIGLKLAKKLRRKLIRKALLW